MNPLAKFVTIHKKLAAHLADTIELVEEGGHVLSHPEVYFIFSVLEERVVKVR